MADKDTKETPTGQNMADALKGWVMVALTLIFVVLYAAALTGWLKPLDNMSMITQLEPIIFVIVGYYFGRLPAQQTEKTLKDEINRQTQKADAAQNAKEQAKQEREALEEKVKNAKAALNVNSLNASRKVLSENETNKEGVGKADFLFQSLETATKILDS
jgi:hypothetical protein